jgi:hypothetical protein
MEQTLDIPSIERKNLRLQLATMRISVICGATTDEEGSRSCAAILDAWRRVRSRNASGLSPVAEDKLNLLESAASVSTSSAHHD